MLNLNEEIFALDVETTGLYAYRGDRPFGFAIADSVNEVYFDDRRHDREIIFLLLKEILENTNNTICIHNAKFDLHHVTEWAKDYFAQEIKINARIVCTAVLSRIANNTRLSCALDDVASSYGLGAKDHTVMEWIRRNKAYRFVTMEDGTVDKNPDFSAVPFNIMEPYAKRDARLCYSIYFKLLADISLLDAYTKKLTPPRSIWNTVEREIKFTKVLFTLEKTGVLTDSANTQRNFEAERSRASAARIRYQEITGREFIDSGANHTASMQALGISDAGVARTATGAISFSKQNIGAIDSTLANPIKDYREANKKANTVLLGLLNSRDKTGRIHTNFGQYTTRTFRLSSTNPNLQNVSGKDDKTGHNLRESFIPDPDYWFVSFDYKAQEMRLLFDLAGEEEVAARIRAGEDTHTVTASLMGVSRDTAKTIGFGLVYGMGIAKLAKDLGVTENEARRLKQLFFDKMPKAAKFIKQVIERAKSGFIANPWGRVYQFTADDSYKAVNYLIQGSGSEIMRDAMIAIHEEYGDNPTVKMVLTVHDEVDFIIHKDHLDEIPNIKRIMESVYNYKILPMEVGVEKSERSWGEVA